MASTSGRVNIATSSNSLIPPNQAPSLPSGGLQHPPDTPAYPPPDTTGLDDGVDIEPPVHCSPPPQEAVLAGLPEAPTTVIPTSNPPAIVINTIAPSNHSSQTVDPVSTNDPQRLSIPSQAARDANLISDTKNSPTPSASSQLWQKALEVAQGSLAKYGLPSIELGGTNSQSATDNIQSLVTELETAHQENKDKQWHYKDRHGNEVALVERLGKIVKSINKYAKIVDTTIQHHPNITSLVWAGARTILQVCHSLLGEAVG